MDLDSVGKSQTYISIIAVGFQSSLPCHMSWSQKRPTPPSSATAGFFQDAPVLQSSFDEDEALKRVYKCKLFNRIL